jgi:hypothetical protein
LRRHTLVEGGQVQPVLGSLIFKEDMDRRLRIAEVRSSSLEHDIDSMQANECSILWYYQPRPFCLSPPS